MYSETQLTTCQNQHSTGKLICKRNIFYSETSQIACGLPVVCVKRKIVSVKGIELCVACFLTIIHYLFVFVFVCVCAFVFVFVFVCTCVLGIDYSINVILLTATNYCY